MMAKVVRMPAAIAGSTEAALQTWLVTVGESVRRGQVIAEIETEKAVFEYESEDEGVVAKLLVDAGAAVAVGAPILVIAEADESIANALAVVSSDESVVAAPLAAELGAAPALAPETAGTRMPAPQRLFATPLVRRLARERGIELASIRGSGPGGRIVRRDVEDVRTPEAPVTIPTAEPVTATSGYTDAPHSPMRRAIARRLTESKTTVPHFYLVAECNVDALLELRRQINAGRKRSISINDAVVKAVGSAMVAVPAANVIWTEEATRSFEQADVAVAVAVDGGLVTPVVKGVDRLTLGEVSRSVADLVERARAGRLRQNELEGGSFSVTNLGMYGTHAFAAIINPPQAGILAVGAVSRRPVVRDDGTIGAASVMKVTLSADHRVLDGALAAEWLTAFVGLIENPLRMLVEPD